MQWALLFIQIEVKVREFVFLTLMLGCLGFLAKIVKEQEIVEDIASSEENESTIQEAVS